MYFLLNRIKKEDPDELESFAKLQVRDSSRGTPLWVSIWNSYFGPTIWGV